MTGVQLIPKCSNSQQHHLLPQGQHIFVQAKEQQEQHYIEWEKKR